MYVLYRMGNNCAKGERKEKEEEVTTVPIPPDEGVTPIEAIADTIEQETEQEVEQEVNEEVLPVHELDPEGRVRGVKRGSIDAHLDDIKKMREMDRRGSTQSTPVDSSITASIDVTVKFKDIEESISTGDLVLLYRHGDQQPNYGIFVNHGECDEHFPLLLIKGKTKPLPLEHFNKTRRDVRIITAVTRLFYGDYERVAIRRLRAGDKIGCLKAMEAAENVEMNVHFTPQELMFITEASTDNERSLYACTFALAHVYKYLGVMIANPVDIRPDTFQDALPLSSPIFIKLPKAKPGPLIGGAPPLLSQLV